MPEKSFKELIEQGVEIREHGDPSASIPIFQEAHAKGITHSQSSEALRHKGLAYEHLSQFYEAHSCYQSAIEEALLDNNITAKARCLRHMASVYLKEGELMKAIIRSKEAWTEINKMDNPPADKVWFSHGIVKILIQEGDSKDEIRKWTRIEYADLKYSLKKEKNKIPKNVWLTGWMMDAAYAWSPWALFLVPIAYLIAAANGLKLRMRQIEKAKL